MLGMDLFLFQKINSLAGDSGILDFIGVFFADYFQYFLTIFLLILLFWPKRNILRNRLMVFSVAVSVVLSRLVITATIRFFYHHARPYVALETVKKLIAENADFKSFPSGHAAIFFAIAMTVYFFNKKMGIFFFIGAFLISVARIFVGVHWPIDILGGAVIGIISAIIISKIIRPRLNHRDEKFFLFTKP